MRFSSLVIALGVVVGGSKLGFVSAVDLHLGVLSTVSAKGVS